MSTRASGARQPACGDDSRVQDADGDRGDSRTVERHSDDLYDVAEAHPAVVSYFLEGEGVDVLRDSLRWFVSS